MSNSDTVIVWAGLRVKDGLADDFIKASQSVINSTRSESGCLKYDLVRDSSDPCVFYFFEEYVDDSAFQKHRSMPYMDEFRKVRAGFLDKFLGVRIMKEVSRR